MIRSSVMCLMLASCAAAPSGDTTLDGDLGAVRFDVAFEPDPPTAGDVTATITLTDLATDAPIDGATVTVEPFMPSMGHGSGEVTVNDLGGGVYEATWTFSMAGAWEVTVSVDDPEDHVTVPVDVE